MEPRASITDRDVKFYRRLLVSVLSNAIHSRYQQKAYLRGNEADTGTLSLLLLLDDFEHFRIGILEATVEELYNQRWWKL
jgi:hypothetical protein